MRRFFYVSQIISGGLVALGQPATCLWMAPLAASFGYALHWRGLESLAPSVARKVSLAWFTFIQLFQLSWMTSIHYQGIYILAVYVFLSLGMGWQFSWLTHLLRKKSRFHWSDIFSLGGVWVLLEWSRMYFFCGFAFNFVGLGLAGYTVSLQMASLFGVLGLSFWVIITNVAGFLALRSRKEKTWVRYWIVLAIVPYCYGGVKLLFAEKGEESRDSYSVLLVQTGLLPGEKYPLLEHKKDFIHPLEQWKQIVEQIKPYAHDKFQLIVFPEAAIPFGWDRKIYRRVDVERVFVALWGELGREYCPKEEEFVSNAYWVKAITRLFKTPVLIGLDYSFGTKNYSSAFFVPVEGGDIVRYDKRVLLPLAESMPFVFLQPLSRFYGIEEFFTPGVGPVVCGKDNISPLICYEELFPSLARESRRLGARFLVSLTNDGWYPFSSLAEQHFTQGLLRAVENGVPLIRCCHTGVTAVIDSRGRVVARLGEKGKENFRGSLPVTFSSSQEQTPFVFWGQTPLIVLSWFLSFSYCIKVLSLKDKKRDSLSLIENGKT